jgi:isoleucyl-tRNA synthetase
LALPPEFLDLLDGETWAEAAIVSEVTPGPELQVTRAPGEKCARCWRVLEEVGSRPAHPHLCLRCDDVVSSLPVQQAAAE